MYETDVVIVGAGPAGAATAINLAPFRRVVLVERRADAVARVGESLVPATRRLFSDMGLWERFLAQKHEPWFCNRSVWGGQEPEEKDFLRDPDGPGWHLDRRRFELWLREVACERGAQLLTPATLDHLEPHEKGWFVRLKADDARIELTARFIIDAAGQPAPVARKLGLRPTVHQSLVCCWMYGRDHAAGGRGLTYIEAVRDGWFYTAPVSDGRRILAFHTDADLPLARAISKPNGLIEWLEEAKGLASLLADVRFVPDGESKVTSARSAMLERVCGEGWLAVGDAAMSFDPLSSQGLFNALFTGLAAAEAADSYLRGDRSSLSQYQQTTRAIFNSYKSKLAAVYASEKRWPEALFWQRRN